MIFKPLHGAAQVGLNERFYLEQAGVDALEVQGEAGEAAQHAKTANRGKKEVAVLLAIAGFDLAGGQHEVKFVDVFAKGAHLPGVFAVYVHGRAAAHGDVGRAGGHRHPPTILDDIFPDALEGNARFDGETAVFRVPLQNAVHAGKVQQYALVVHGGVAVAVAAAAQANGAVVLRRPAKNIAQLAHGAGAVNIGHAAVGAAPTGRWFQPIGGQG